MQKQRIFLMGDIHGDVTPVQMLYERNPNLFNENADPASNILILLGDVGANYYLNKKDEKFKKQLEEYPFTYFCIRGNHEARPSKLAEKDPEAWRLNPMFGGYVWIEKAHPRIIYARDMVSVYNFNGYKTLVIPGAYSVDKYYRIQNGFRWFEDEQLSLKEQTQGIKCIERNGWTVDLVLSHTCPAIYEPTDLFLSTIDQSMVDKSMERYLGGIEYSLKYRAWLWGHYHDYREYPRNECPPSISDPRCLMLFNDCAVDLDEVMMNPYALKKF